MAPAVLSWFKSEVYLWRTIAAVGWSVLSVPVSTAAFLFFAGISITQPTVWITETLCVCCSFNFLVSVCIISMPLVLGARFSLPHFSVSADVYRTRLSSALSLLQWCRLPLLVAYCLSGAVCSWGLLRLLGSSMNSITYIQNTKDYSRAVLNEKYLFLVEAGIVLGFLQFVQFFWAKQYYLAFPHIQRHKIFHIQRAVGCTLRGASLTSVKNVALFYGFYIIFGGGIKLWIKQSFNISEDETTSSLTSVFGLLDVGLLWQTYTLSVVLTSLWTMSSQTLRILHTQILEFEIQNLLEAKQDCNLIDAMGCAESPLLQHLAFYDFRSLCRHSPHRRQELLALSQPGGHPRVWIAVNRIALQVIKDMSLKVQEANRFIMSRVSGHSQGPQMEMSQKYSAVLDSDSDSALDNTGDSLNTQLSAQGHPSPLKKFSMANLPFLKQLVSENPEVASRHLFASCQMHIWAVEGLSHIACWSYTEDKYGVVQSSLTALLYTLIDLHEAIEKHFKCTGVVRRPQSSLEESSDASLPHQLHSVTRTAVYRLVDTYRKHLDDLHLSPEYVKKLQSFSEFLF